MMMQRIALAAMLSAGFAAPALAAEPVTNAATKTTVIDQNISSNRLATAKIWADAADASQRMRQAVSVGDWTQALVKVRVTRAHVENLQKDKVVVERARMLAAELRPYVLDLEARITRRDGSSLRYADQLLRKMDRTKNELIAQGYMERMTGGGAGTAVPKQPEVLIIPNGQPIPPGAVPVTPEQAPVTQPQQAPGNDRNQLDEQRFPQE